MDVIDVIEFVIILAYGTFCFVVGWVSGHIYERNHG